SFQTTHDPRHRDGPTLVYPEQKSIFARSPFEILADWNWIARDGFSVEGDQPVGEQRRILDCDRSRMPKRSRIPGLVAYRVNLLLNWFEELQTEFLSSISEPARGEDR